MLHVNDVTSKPCYMFIEECTGGLQGAHYLKDYKGCKQWKIETWNFGRN